MSSETTDPRVNNFLREIIKADIEAGTYGGRVATRFPPEPNGYPHLGHAQTICLNFGLAKDFGGTCNLRYDDTNPETENPEFVAALEDAVRWLGFEPAEICFASDYFEQFYEWAVDLVKKGLAYVDSQSGDEIRTNRGTVTEPGVNSPFRDRSVEENLRLLDEMRLGKHPDGSHVLRAKIDMADDNMLLRDPLMYRIRRGAHHYRRGSDWSIYPLYDWAHGQGDAIEKITHSICTLEFDVHRPLYNWFLDAIGIEEPRNHQYEFARFNLDYTVMSKRKLRGLVEDGHVRGWDDPRMPTLAAQKRRGVRPAGIRSFFDQVGITRVDGSIDLAFFEHAIRDDLNHVAPRVMAVSKPLKVEIQNLAEGKTSWTDAPYWPHDITPPEGSALSRRVPLTREIWIEQDDFLEVAAKGWRRLSLGESVRLRYGPVIECTGVDKDAEGAIQALRAEVVDDSDSANVKGVIHWVSSEHGIPAKFRLYDRLFTDPQPDALDDFMTVLNPISLVETSGFVEPSIAEDPSETRYQFERRGYFWQDPEDSGPDALVFNRIVALRDSWGKKETSTSKAVDRATSESSDVGGTRGISSPRDPASALTVDQQITFGGLVTRGVGEEEAAVLAGEAALLDLFESIVNHRAQPENVAKLLVHHFRPSLKDREIEESKATPESLAEVLDLLDANTITSSAVGEIVKELVDNGGNAAAIVQARGLAAVRDIDTLAPFVDAVVADNPDEVTRFLGGEQRLIGFFTGQVMQKAGKGADAKTVQTLLREKLGN